MTPKIKVSVCVVAYNQEKYISRCLKSLVEQDAGFEYEIIVGDDASTDNTARLIQEFSEIYPGLIRPIFHKKNIGAVNNILSVYKVARGQYIAHLDGDDYALPSKLRRQADVLDSNPACVICSHDVLVVNSNGKILRESFRRHKSGVNTLMDLYAQLPFFAHSSKMFINNFNSVFWSRFHDETLDVEIHIEQAKVGSIYHLDEVLGAYRLFTGISAEKKCVNPLLANGNIRIYEAALKDKCVNHKLIKKYYSNCLFRFAYQSAVFGDSRGVKYYSRRSCKIGINSFVQIVFLLVSFMPLIAVGVCRFRAKLRGYR